MSYNMNLNFGDDFYSTKSQGGGGGDSRLEFADVSSNQFFNPNAYSTGYAPPPTGQQQQQTSYDAPQQQNAGYYNDWSQQPSGSFFTPTNEEPFGVGPGSAGSVGSTNPNDFESEPPLLEELGINFDHIYRKTKCVLNPFAKPHESIIHDEDLAGPLVFCIAYGFSLLLMGKIQFGYIYGITALGCLCMYTLLNLMSEKGVNAACIGSILGYCLLPMVILSFLSTLFSLDAAPRLILSLFFILWCSIASSKLFVYSLTMSNQQLLVLYPCFLLYGILALLNVF